MSATADQSERPILDVSAHDISIVMTAPTRVPRTLYTLYGKRVFDMVSASILLVVLAPVYSSVWLVVRLGLGRPIYFSQERVGWQGQKFTMQKFRTMKPDRRSQTGDENHPRTYDKDPDDPRHTGLGRRLRRSSLDELPQIVHVVTGQMSLVGPRPEIWSTALRDRQLGHSRELVRPGLTGLWQVDSRDSDDVVGRLRLDEQYVRTVSFRTDLSILLRTIRVVAAGTGV